MCYDSCLCVCEWREWEKWLLAWPRNSFTTQNHRTAASLSSLSSHLLTSVDRWKREKDLMNSPLICAYRLWVNRRLMPRRNAMKKYFIFIRKQLRCVTINGRRALNWNVFSSFSLSLALSLCPSFRLVLLVDNSSGSWEVVGHIVSVRGSQMSLVIL